MLVSIIIPVYNVEEYLARCLDSVLGQTERNLEIICVNDGSTDSSRTILGEYAAKDPRIRIIDRENGGLAVARNSGLEVFSGDYVMFIDSDDWIPPDAVEKFLAVAKSSDAPVVVSSAFARNRLDCARRSEVIWRWVAPALAGIVGRRELQSSVCNKFYRADIVRSRRFCAGILFEDWVFVTELFGGVDRFAIIDEPLYVYCTNNVSTTRSPFSRHKLDSYITGIRRVDEYFAGHPMRKYALKRIGYAVNMLVSKIWKSGNLELAAILLATDLGCYPMSFKTRFRLWRMRHRVTVK